MCSYLKQYISDGWLAVLLSSTLKEGTKLSCLLSLKAIAWLRLFLTCQLQPTLCSNTALHTLLITFLEALSLLPNSNVRNTSISESYVGLSYCNKWNSLTSALASFELVGREKWGTGGVFRCRLILTEPLKTSRIFRRISGILML